jgi:predicted site-specific integrase-resolvase
MSLKKLLNRSQLARHLGVAHATLARWINEGKIKPVAEDGNGRELFNASTSRPK